MTTAWRAALGLIAVVIGPVVATAHTQAPPTYAGDIWSRPRLTGDWGGFRDQLAKKGVVFDADLLLMPQGVLSGGRDTGAGFWGNAEYTLNVDTGKAGLWPGGFLKVAGLTGFGDTVLTQPVFLRILERFFPALLTPVHPPTTSNDTWAVFYAFDQYLWQPAAETSRGIGIFFTFGVATAR